jgi:hypothetical protein
MMFDRVFTSRAGWSVMITVRWTRSIFGFLHAWFDSRSYVTILWPYLDLLDARIETPRLLFFRIVYQAGYLAYAKRG